MINKFAFKILAPVCALALGTLVATPFVSTANAQSEESAPVILIVDQARLIGTSKAGQSIAEQMKTLQDTANKELEETIGAIVSEAEELDSKKGSMGEEEYLQQAKRIAVAQNNIPVLREIKVRELQLSEQQAISQISEQMRPILKEIVEQRGATLLLDRSAVMYASTNTDITDEVRQRLDEKLTSVQVQRVSLVNEGQQQQQ